MSKKKGLADPSRLTPINKSDDKIITVIIETPKGSRNKYAFDKDARVFGLKKVLPAGMNFPYDFGFLPSTLADDGDPTDLLVLMDEPAFPGCVLKCRIVGIIQGEQSAEKKTERNDRIIAIEQDNHSYASVKHVDDFGKEFVRELEDFFVNYHKLIGKEYKILGWKGPKAAQRCIREGMKAARREAR
jgi:inorganic pyrophosphatase